jgi:hypothetical protein
VATEKAPSRRFLDEYLGRFPQPAQCEVSNPTSGQRCPEDATFTLDTGREKVGKVCDRCLPTWLTLLTKKGRTVIVAAVESPPSRTA